VLIGMVSIKKNFVNIKKSLKGSPFPSAQQAKHSDSDVLFKYISMKVVLEDNKQTKESHAFNRHRHRFLLHDCFMICSEIGLKREIAS